MTDDKNKHNAISHEQEKYSGNGTGSTSNSTGAINEFEDNLSIDWNDERAGDSNTTSVTNRLSNKSKSPQKHGSFLSKLFKLFSAKKII